MITKENNDNIDVYNDYEFLDWFTRRMSYRYREQPPILDRLVKLKNEYMLIPKKLSIKQIDKICKKHYADFDIDKADGLSFGYTDQERQSIRKFVLDIISSLSINNNE